MPVIKTDTLFFENVEFRRVVKIDSKGTFTSDLPPQVAKVLGFESVSADTMPKCLGAWNQAVKKYEESATTTEKIIIYEVRSECYIWDDAKDRLVFKSDSLSFCAGIGVAVSAGVFLEHKTTQADGKATYSYDEAESKLPKGMSDKLPVPRAGTEFRNRPRRTLPWTQEREDFFARIGRGLEAVILQLQQLSDPTKALEFADKGRLSLGVGKATDLPTPCAEDPNAEPPRDNDGPKICPCCERPNQFGEVCQQCKGDIERERDYHA